MKNKYYSYFCNICQRRTPHVLKDDTLFCLGCGVSYKYEVSSWIKISKKKAENKNKKKRLLKSSDKLNKTTQQLVLARATRIWVQKTPKIHALNYWYYRYFTNEFELFILLEKDVEGD